MPLLFNASHVASLAHALLAGYIGFILFRGARSPARRRVARSLGWFSLYSLFFTTILTIPRTYVDLANLPLLTPIFLCVTDLNAYAMWLLRGSKPADPVSPSARLVWGTALVWLSIAALTTMRFVKTGNGEPGTSLSLVLLSVLFGMTLVFALRARARSIRGAGAIAIAAITILVPAFFLLCLRVGIWDLATYRPTYLVVRDLMFIVFPWALFIHYLDDGHEPMTIENRIVAGALTCVLSVEMVASRLIDSSLARALPADQARIVTSGEDLRVLALLVVSAALVIGLVPRMFRRSLVLPMDRLTRALDSFQRGDRVDVPIYHEDEIGKMTRSFNAMANAIADGRARLEDQLRLLETKNTEVSGLNEELRRQVAARSRQLSDALARVDPHGAALAEGDVVDDRYRVDGRLGAGGMGIVYAVTRITDKRQLALKVMSRGTAREDGVRFAREAEIAAGLAHENLVGVRDVGMHDGAPYLVMDRIDGGSLEDARDRWRDVAWCTPILAQIAEGLAALHGSGIMHRDLKPANVLLAREGGRIVAKISDFGIARREVIDALGATASIDGTTEPANAKTATGVIGTLAYLAPELARSASALSPACDVYAFGIVAYELYTGASAYAVPAILASDTLPEPAALPASVPPEVARAIRACVDPRPATRPTARALQEILQRAA